MIRILLLTLLLAGPAMAGNMGKAEPPQRQEVIAHLDNPVKHDDDGPNTLIIVAILGLVGTLGSAYLYTRRR